MSSVATKPGKVGLNPNNESTANFMSAARTDVGLVDDLGVNGSLAMMDVKVICFFVAAPCVRSNQTAGR